MASPLATNQERQMAVPAGTQSQSTVDSPELQLVETGWYHATQRQIDEFASLSGDRNKIHLEEGIIHGAYIIARLSAYVWEQFGDGTMALEIGAYRISKEIRVGDEYRFSHNVVRCRRGIVSIEVIIERRRGGEIVSFTKEPIPITLLVPSE